MSSAESLRTVSLTRTGPTAFRASNVRGGTLDIGSGETAEFTPVELLLAAMAGCSGIDVDMLTSRLAEPTRFEVTAQGHKVRADDGSNRMEELRVEFTVEFPEGDQGHAARERLPAAVAMSRDRLCTVTRTVALPSPVQLETA